MAGIHISCYIIRAAGRIRRKLNKKYVYEADPNSMARLPEESGISTWIHGFLCYNGKRKQNSRDRKGRRWNDIK